jgi:hypothetical protein
MLDPMGKNTDQVSRKASNQEYYNIKNRRRFGGPPLYAQA